MCGFEGCYSVCCHGNYSHRPKPSLWLLAQACLCPPNPPWALLPVRAEGGWTSGMGCGGVGEAHVEPSRFFSSSSVWPRLQKHPEMSSCKKTKVSPVALESLMGHLSSGVFSCASCSHGCHSASMASFQKCTAAKKIKQSMGNKSMSFPTGKSDRYVPGGRCGPGNPVSISEALGGKTFRGSLPTRSRPLSFGRLAGKGEVIAGCQSQPRPPRAPVTLSTLPVPYGFPGAPQSK